MTAQWTRIDVNPITVVLEVAFGADVTTDPSTWAWTDISTRMKGTAEISRGRPDESTQTAPSSCTVVLDNTDSQLTPRHPLSQYRGLWGLGTQMRIKVKNRTSGISFVRCQGGVTEIEYNWPSGHSSYATIEVTFRGALYRLGQGKDLRSAMYRLISADKPDSYWPMEDGKDTTTLAEYHGGSPMLVSGGASFGSGGPTTGASAPLVTLNDNTILYANVSMPTSITAWTLEFFANLAAAQATPSRALITWRTPLGSVIKRWHMGLYVNAGTDTLSLEAFNDTDVRLFVFTTPFTYQGNEAYGLDLYWSICARQNGSNLEFEFSGSTENGEAFFKNGGSWPSTIGRIESLYTTLSGLGGWTYGHISAWGRALDTSFGSHAFPHASSIKGQSGDGAETRIANLAAAAQVPFNLRATPPLAITTRMGTLAIGTALAGMREAETADIGILTDGLTSGLDYLPRAVRYNRAVAMTLDGTQGHIKLPFTPIESDQRLRNSETVQRTGGSSASAIGPTYINQGTYTENVSLNVFSDDVLPHQAGFRLNLGATDTLRVPVLMVDLRDKPELIQKWLDNCDIGARIQATNLPSQFPVGSLDYVIEQYKEKVDAVTWGLEIIGSPFAPWRAFVIEDSTLGRLDTSGSKLQNAVSTTATSWSVVTTTGSIWTTQAGDRPFDIDCEGEQVRVTNVTSASSPQTFTVTRSINGVIKTHAANAPLSLWQPAVLAL